MSASDHDDDGVHEEHEEHANHEAWVIPYADLLTLLMAMFIALFAISSVNKDKAKALEAGFNRAVNGKPLSGLFDTQGGEQVFPGDGATGGGITDGSTGDGGETKPGDNPRGNNIIKQLLDRQARIDAEKFQQKHTLEGVKQRIEDAANKAGLGDKLSFELRPDGLVVRVVTDQVLFESGSAQLQEPGVQVLGIVGDALRGIDNRLFIDGYTDNNPISTSAYPSNWELSGARATAVLRFLAEQVGLDVDRLDARAKGETHPVASNATAAGQAKNRRVEIIVQSKVIQDLLDTNDLSSDSPSASDNLSGSADPNLDNVVGDIRSEHS